jgi:hypothetical protein
MTHDFIQPDSTQPDPAGKSRAGAKRTESKPSMLEQTRYSKGERRTTSVPANSNERSRILAAKGRDILGSIGGILSAECDSRGTTSGVPNEGACGGGRCDGSVHSYWLRKWFSVRPRALRSQPLSRQPLCSPLRKPRFPRPRRPRQNRRRVRRANRPLPILVLLRLRRPFLLLRRRPRLPRRARVPLRRRVRTLTPR